MKWLLSFAALLGISLVSMAVDKRPPNFVIVLADDAGYGDLGCFGNQLIRTPNLDQMAKDGIRFTDFYVAQAVCSASRTALLTGCYPNRVGILGALNPMSKNGISDKEMTIAQVLKTKGYATGIYGKWHLGHRAPFLPTHHGFDDYLGLPYSNDMLPNMRNTFPELPLIDGDKTIEKKPGPEPAHDPLHPSGPFSSSTRTKTSPSSCMSRTRCRTCRSTSPTRGAASRKGASTAT